VFVVDSYTRRIFERHDLAGADAGYDEIRLGVEKALAGEAENATHPGSGAGDGQHDANASASHAGLTIHPPSVASQMDRSELSQVYNEFHALLVQTAKHYCAKGAPKCEACPLRSLLAAGKRAE
jgi:endonuclease III-like uncharacterized protein